mmetsp:Transcript_23132/g.67419  ORF Transcript_23132/g.67419 Transcript_23132/m.67419 type:complete len:210 (-) Transcript_23132:462-1091(-)
MGREEHAVFRHSAGKEADNNGPEASSNGPGPAPDANDGLVEGPVQSNARVLIHNDPGDPGLNSLDHTADRGGRREGLVGKHGVHDVQIEVLDTPGHAVNVVRCFGELGMKLFCAAAGDHVGMGAKRPPGHGDMGRHPFWPATASGKEGIDTVQPVVTGRVDAAKGTYEQHVPVSSSRRFELSESFSEPRHKIRGKLHVVLEDKSTAAVW